MKRIIYRLKRSIRFSIHRKKFKDLYDYNLSEWYNGDDTLMTSLLFKVEWMIKELLRCNVRTVDRYTTVDLVNKYASESDKEILKKKFMKALIKRYKTHNCINGIRYKFSSDRYLVLHIHERITSPSVYDIDVTVFDENSNPVESNSLLYMEDASDVASYNIINSLCEKDNQLLYNVPGLLIFDTDEYHSFSDEFKANGIYGFRKSINSLFRLRRDLIKFTKFSEDLFDPDNEMTEEEVFKVREEIYNSIFNNFKENGDRWWH